MSANSPPPPAYGAGSMHAEATRLMTAAKHGDREAFDRLVESLRGQRLVVYDAFPQLFKDMSKTYAEMITAGLLAAPHTP